MREEETVSEFRYPERARVVQEKERLREVDEMESSRISKRKVGRGKGGRTSDTRHSERLTAMQEDA